MEKTLILLKPDAVARRLVGKITSRFEDKGLILLDMKMVNPDVTTLTKHYSDLSTKSYFPDILTSMTAGPIIAQIWCGKNSIKTIRKMVGTTEPKDALPGTIRGDYCMDIGKNIVHASDSPESANKEILIWFPDHSNNAFTTDHPNIYRTISC